MAARLKAPSPRGLPESACGRSFAVAQSYVACVFLIAVCSAGMIKGRSAFVWLAVALWFVSSGFAAFWLWGTDLAWLLFFPGLPVPLDMIVEFLPATKTLAPPSTS